MSDAFYPLNEHLTERLEFQPSEIEVLDGDLKKRIRGPKAVVKLKGLRYVAYGMDCDSTNNCTCETFIKRLRPGERPPELADWPW